MRTVRLLPVSPSMHCSWGVYLPGGVPAGQGVYLPGEGVYLPRGGGCTCQGVTCRGGTCPGTPPCEQNDWQTGVKT